jgi:hypothetical protein
MPFVFRQAQRIDECEGAPDFPGRFSHVLPHHRGTRPSQFRAILMPINGSPGFFLLSNSHSHEVRARYRIDTVTGLNPSGHQETAMNQFIRAGAIMVAIFGSVGFAAAREVPAPNTPI